MNDILRRIRRLTKLDLEKKTLDELQASTIEEIGELSREIKIEEKVAGNTYKQLDEGSAGEAVDVAICGLCMYFSDLGGTKSASESLSKSAIMAELPQIPIFKQLLQLAGYSGYISAVLAEDRSKLSDNSRYSKKALEIARIAMRIYYDQGYSEEEFWTAVSAKLDKWEGSK